MSGNTNKPLSRYTLKCPKDEMELWFETIGMLRVKHNNLYRAYCPKCESHYEVIADNKK
jgi:hypothetical protein